MTGGPDRDSPSRPGLKVLDGGRAEPAPLPGRDALTDLSNAQRLVREHGNDLHYVPDCKEWLVWDGRQYALNSLEVERRTKSAVLRSYREARLVNDPDKSKALFRHAKASEAQSRIKAMIELARSEPGIAISPRAC